MHYKTIALELIRDQPDLYEELRVAKMLLTVMDVYAIELKAGHEAWRKAIASRRPDGAPSQVAAEALELAIRDLRDRLPSASPRDEVEPADPEAATPSPLTPPE